MTQRRTTRSPWLRGTWLVMLLVGVAIGVSCGDATNPDPDPDPDPEPTTGALRVTVASSGDDVDNNGYTVQLDGAAKAAIGVNASVTIGDLAPATYAVSLAGLAENCSLSTANPMSVAVVAGETADADFAVACVAAVGSVEVTIATTGEALDDDGYTVAVLGGQSSPANVNGVVTLTDVPVGARTVELTGVAANCEVTGANPVAVSVAFDQTAQTGFDVVCFTPPPGIIAFLSERDGLFPGEVFVMDGAGGNVTRVTDMTEEKSVVRLSPNGTKVLFKAAQDLWVVNTDGTGLLNLTNSPSLDEGEVWPAWSPDGSRIVFSRTDCEDGVTNDACSMWTVNADGSGLSQLAPDAPPGFNAGGFDWSPDGSRIVLSAWRQVGFGKDLYVVNGDGTNLQQLTDGGEGYFHEHPAWSPDGTMIALATWDSNNDSYFHLAVIDADGTGLTQLTDDVLGEDVRWQPAWSPDGSVIAFSCGGLCVINRDGSGLVRATAPPLYVWWTPGWAPDGSVVGFTGTPEGQWDVYTIRPDGTGLRNLTNLVTSDQFGSWAQ